MKNPLTPAGIEPATFRFVAQRLNHCATAGPKFITLSNKISDSVPTCTYAHTMLTVFRRSKPSASKRVTSPHFNRQIRSILHVIDSANRVTLCRLKVSPYANEISADRLTGCNDDHTTYTGFLHFLRPKHVVGYCPFTSLHVVCLMTAPQPPSKRGLPTVRASPFSFNLQYPLFSLR